MSRVISKNLKKDVTKCHRRTGAEKPRRVTCQDV
nr:MAG TPA: hypothetical protein [Caudoviricetes sp.]